MAHYDLEEQEQLDNIKTWWKMYGNQVTTVITVFCVVVIAWQGWGWYQRSQAAQASAVFHSLELAIADKDVQKTKTTAGQLTEKFEGTSYASLGALLAAKQSFDLGDLKTAKSQLGWAVNHGQDEIKDLARLRLAVVLLDEKAYDDALKQLDGSHATAFDSRFQELKGDIYSAQGKRNEARLAYKAAQDKLQSKLGPGLELIQQKIDSLGGAA